MVRAVIIDSGILESHRAFRNMKILQKIGFSQKDGRIIADEDVTDVAGHGTAVAGVFAKMCGEAGYIIVKVFQDDTLQADIPVIVSALEYVYQNIECDMIHMSLGCREDNPALEEVCRKLTDRGTVIVSAFDNAGGISFPAAYENVVGVDVTPYCSKPEEFIYVKNSHINVFVRSAPTRVAWNRPPYYCLRQGSSFSAPFVSAFIIRAMMSGTAPEDIMGELEKNSIKVIELEQKRQMEVKIPFKIKKAAIFPYNKETQALVKFHDMLDFEIVAVCDLKHSMNVGKKLPEIGQVIADICEYDFTGVDTLIVGHISELIHTTHDNPLHTILKRCGEERIKIYSFDRTIREYCTKLPVPVECVYPNIIQDNTAEVDFGKLYSIPIPVVGIYGTGSRQGKFTLQLLLRKKFMELGYSVGQVGSEPESLLFGMDGVIPFGYHSTVNLEGRNFIAAVNRVLYECSRGKDILFVGSQSGCVPMLYNNVAQITLEQIEFSIAAAADVAVLCVNIDDDLDYIKRTMDAVYGLAQTRIICLAIFPMKYKSNWGFLSNVKERVSEEEIAEFARNIKAEFGVNSYVIDEEHVEQFADEIINVLAE